MIWQGSKGVVTETQVKRKTGGNNQNYQEGEDAVGETGNTPQAKSILETDIQSGWMVLIALRSAVQH